jgi:adenylyltransferase/sulfurtransferase
MGLSKSEFIRYARHIIIPEIGIKGQEKIKNSSICVIGAGGLGNICLSYLAGSGVRTIGVIDYSNIELSNLHRQVIYSTNDIGMSKIERVGFFLKGINPEIKIETYDNKIEKSNLPDIVNNYDVIVDCTDNFDARFLINEVCFEFKKPYVFGAIYRFEGQVSFFDSNSGPCLRCLYKEIWRQGSPLTCAEEGILGPVAAAVGSIQCIEVLKFILGLEVMKNKLLVMDFANDVFNLIEITKRPDCPVCSGRKDATGRSRLPDSKAVKSEGLRHVLELPYIFSEDLKTKFDRGEKFILFDLRHEWEHDLCHIPGDRWFDFENADREIKGINPESEIILYCKNESRSVSIYKILKEKRFKNIKILKGGIDAWAEKIDKGMIRY